MLIFLALETLGGLALCVAAPFGVKMNKLQAFAVSAAVLAAFLVAIPVVAAACLMAPLAYFVREVIRPADPARYRG